MATASDAEVLGPLLAAVAPLAAPFAAAGHQLHVVGGSVRDALLGVGDSGDLDLTTDARPEQTLALVRALTDTVWTQGQRFGTIGAEVEGRLFEITTHRTERYEPSSRKPHVAFADALDEDLARRDFTINALAVDVETGELVDPHGGRADLADGVLRTPLEPEVSFVDDPLRMLRAGRFVARFGLTPVDELVDAAAVHAARIEIVSVERILDELTKLLALPRPVVGMRFLAGAGLLERVLPGAVVDPSLDEVAADPAVRLAVLLRGLGAGEAERRMRHLRASNDLLAAVRSLLVALDALPEAPVGGPDVRRWAALGSGWRQALALAVVLDPVRAAPVQRVVDELGRTEDLDDQSLPVDGDDVMRELGLARGPAVGAALDRLRALRIERGPLSRAEAIESLRTHG